MTQDNGMDAGPSWEELMAERDALSAERQGLRKVIAKLGAENREIRREADALAAYVEAIGEYMRDQWPGAYAKVFERFGDVDPTTTLARVRGEVRHQVAEEWELALPRLKAEWQAEALESAAYAFRNAPLAGECRRWHHVAAGTLEAEADKLRRQAEESANGHH